MLQAVTEPRVGAADAVRESHLTAFRFMLRARLLDDKFAALYRTGKIHGGVFLGRGQEALSAALGVSLKKTDVFAPLIRDAAGRMAFGEPIIDAVRNYLGSALGPMRGRDGNVHRGRPQEGYLPMISHLGAMVSVVNGVLFARRLKKTAARPCGGRQPVCILHSHRPAICVRKPRGQGRWLWCLVSYRRCHRFDRVLDRQST